MMNRSRYIKTCFRFVGIKLFDKVRLCFKPVLIEADVVGGTILTIFYKEMDGTKYILGALK